MLNVADNTGARKVQCFHIFGGSRRRWGQIGDLIVGTVKEAEPRRLVKKSDIVRAVIVRQKKPYRRDDGTSIRFDDNAVVIVKDREPLGTRILGPIPREIREKGFEKIVVLAPEIV